VKVNHLIVWEYLEEPLCRAHRVMTVILIRATMYSQALANAKEYRSIVREFRAVLHFREPHVMTVIPIPALMCGMPTVYAKDFLWIVQVCLEVRLGLAHLVTTGTR